MKLFYSPGACALSPHIVLCELGLPHELVKVDLKRHQTADGGDYYAINPKGYVPALQLDDGQVLTEGPAIVQYLADLQPAAGLLPPVGSLARVRVQEWLNFISSEIHKTFGPLFHADAAAEWKTAARTNLDKRLAFVEQALKGRDYLSGSDFCVADAYLFTVLRWAPLVHLDLAAMPALTAFVARVAARPAVQTALRAEGLIP